MVSSGIEIQMLYYFVATIFVVNCLVLLLAILIQQGKAGDMASAFGGGSSQAAFGARTGATLLTKVTWVSASLFFAGALALTIVTTRGPGSVIGSVPAPPAATKPATPPATQPAPVTPAPATTPAPAPK
jgi:preprotein translocase subunit SecG